MKVDRDRWIVGLWLLGMGLLFSRIVWYLIGLPDQINLLVLCAGALAMVAAAALALTDNSKWK